MDKQEKHDVVMRLYGYGLSARNIRFVTGYSESYISRIIKESYKINEQVKEKENKDPVDWAAFNPGLLNIERKDEE